MFDILKYLPSALLFIVFSCNSPAKKENNKTLNDPKKGRFISQKFGGCDTLTNQGVSVVVHVWEPVDSSEAAERTKNIIAEKVINRINSYADSASLASNPTAKTSIKAASDVFSANYQSFKKEFPDSPGCWEVEVTGDTVMMTDHVLLYQFDHYAFTGGAHPNSFRSYHIFDLDTGNETEVQTFVSDTVALLKKVEFAFRKEEKLDGNTDLEEAGYFLADHQFFMPANYTFTRTGVFFYYNPYEIAAYVRGPISFTIPYSDLEGIVKKDLIF